ncbi:MAG: TolC family protein [Prevotellaceae bacterium]|nr:TolC family protein [Prevotellaceae bacterium]
MKKIFFPLFCLLASMLYGQETVLSLSECIQIGLENNYALRIVRNQEEISSNNYTPGNAGFLPSLDLSGGYDGSLMNTKNKSADGSKTSANGIFNDGIDAGLTLNWTIFDGLKMQATYARLKELQQMGELQTRLSVEELIARIASEYNNHIYQLLRLKNIKASVDLSTERVRIVEARYQIGAASVLDLNQAKVDLNTDISNHISQKEVVSYSSVNLNKLLANEDVEASFLLADSIINFNSLTDFESLRSNTLQSNTDMLLAAKNVKLSEADKKAIRSRYFPYLKLNGGYGYGLNRYETGATRESQSLGFNYGITVGINLFEGFNTKRELKNVELEIENKELLQQEIRLNLIATLSNLYLSYQNNRELRAIARQNKAVARAYYEAAIDKYKLGSLSGLELREAQQSMLNAAERLILAEYNIKLCEISLKQISGDILSYLSNEQKNE